MYLAHASRTCISQATLLGSAGSALAQEEKCGATARVRANYERLLQRLVEHTQRERDLAASLARQRVELTQQMVQAQQAQQRAMPTASEIDEAGMLVVGDLSFDMNFLDDEGADSGSDSGSGSGSGIEGSGDVQGTPTTAQEDRTQGIVGERFQKAGEVNSRL